MTDFKSTSFSELDFKSTRRTGIQENVIYVCLQLLRHHRSKKLNLLEKGRM